MNEPVRPSLSRRSWMATTAAKIFSATFLTFSVLALVIAGGYACNADQYMPSSNLITVLSLAEAFLCFLMIVGGMALYLHWRSPVSRLTFWQILLIILVAGLGLFFSFRVDSYQVACCNVVYHVGRGFPLAFLRLSYEPDTETHYSSWGKVDELIAQHPDQVHQEIIWPAIVANALFFVHAALLVVVLFRRGLDSLRVTHPWEGS